MWTVDYRSKGAAVVDLNATPTGYIGTHCGIAVYCVGVLLPTASRPFASRLAIQFDLNLDCRFQGSPLISPFSTSAARSSLARVVTLARSVAAA